MSTEVERKNPNGGVETGEKDNSIEKFAVETDYTIEGFKAQIDEKKLTWQQAAFLLLTEYVVLAILAFPYSFQVLGMAGGTIATLLIGATTLYTSHVLWRYCMAHPQARDICDCAQLLTGGKRWAWWAAFVGLALNNYCIMGLHVVAGATAIQTIRGGKECTLVWGVFMGVIMLLGSLLREMKHMSQLGLLASSTMFICFLIVVIGHGAQGTPNGWVEGTRVTYTVWAPEGTTFVDGMEALLNIVYTYIGHALIPTFVLDMAHPEDFPKALYLSMTAEFILFTICGAVVYFYAGTAYTTAPAYGSLIEKYGKVAAGFTLPTIIIVGILYSLVTSRAIFFQIYRPGSKHRLTHTVQGWIVWGLVVLGGWIISFIIGEAVPFFNDLLALISSLFDSWFGYIFWGFAFFQLNRGKWFKGVGNTAESILSALMIITGVYFFGAGTYASIQSIINHYAKGAIKAPFQCTNTGFTFTR